jgi:hypothetical protein
VEIVAALFIENIDMRQAAGPSTRIDLTGVHFSLAAPSEFPVTLTPHLVVLAHCAENSDGFGALEVVFERQVDGEAVEVAKSTQPVQIEPGKFTRQLVQAQLPFDEPGTVVAHCRLAGGPVTTVPYTVLAYVPGAAVAQDNISS